MANSTVAALTAASALDGTELYYTVQGGLDRKATGAQIKTLTSAAPTITGHPTVEGVTSTGATGTGNFVFSISPTITGHMTVEGVTATGATGTGKFVFDGSPTLVTPTLGVATATSLNGNTFTTGTYTLTGTAGKTLNFTNTITLSGTDSTTMTFPPASASIGYLGLPSNGQNTGYTAVLGDAGKVILMQTAGTFTIPANGSVAYQVGTVLTFANTTTSSSIAITTDTMTLAGTATTGTRTLAANGIATALKVASTAWFISGSGLT